MEKETVTKIGKVALLLDVSAHTIKNWYLWYEDPKYKKPAGLELPPCTRDQNGTRYFSKQAIKELKQFKKDLDRGGKYRGCMAEFNAKRSWGQRGKEYLEKKQGEVNND